MTAQWESTLHGLFPTLIMKTRVENRAALNGKLLPEMMALKKETPNGRPDHWASQAYTTMETARRLHTTDALSGISAVIKREARCFADQLALDLTNDEMKINACWLTVLKKGQATDVHNNPNSVFTALYFLQAPAKSAPVLLLGPTKDLWLSVPVLEENQLNMEVESYRPSSGDLLMFSSNMLHNLHVHEDQQDLISLTFTVTLESLGG